MTVDDVYVVTDGENSQIGSESQTSLGCQGKPFEGGSMGRGRGIRGAGSTRVGQLSVAVCSASIVSH